MSDHRLVIVECPQAYSCSSFVCNEATGKFYYVGNPHSGALHSYEAFCEKCIKNLVMNLPAELSPTTADLETKLRAEISIEYHEILAKHVAEHENAVRQEADRYIAFKLAEAQNPFGEIPTEAAEVEVSEDKQLYRCLECNTDFETAEALKAHKETHNVTPPEKNKGGRPKKVQA